MPPIRTKYRSKLAGQEDEILLALQAIQKGNDSDLFAQQLGIWCLPDSTPPRNRTHGIQSRVDTRLNGHKLTKLEEDSLTE